jgi:hypothetical protein
METFLKAFGWNSDTCSWRKILMPTFFVFIMTEVHTLYKREITTEKVEIAIFQNHDCIYSGMD